ncbi:hypothetical protein HPB49_020225 [Dermacentor silvarum]|uniref:Uncharacterized protein n=1 Tax=Dermacentor silvarum TaxID=543639 RepID=A0ACB8CMC8_DERSI|nr:hypothetical protein HPB49_020225 [Dermacentor silvarum]
MGASCAPRKMAALGQQQDLRPTFHHCALHLYLINSGAPSPFPNHPDWAPNVFAFKKANREAEEKKCDRYERTLKRKRCSASNHGSAAHTGCVVAAYAAYASRDKANAEAESDGDAVTSTLFLGDIEPDPTDGEDEMEPDRTDDEASNDLPESMQLLQAQLPAPSHHIGGFSRNLQARMQEKYLEKCRAYNALQERYLIMENELRDLRAKRSSEANGAAAAWGYAAIAGHSEKVAYYTGLPNKETFAWVVSVYRTACPSVETMSHEDQVLLVLMRLLLDIHLCFLADLFKINKNYVSTIFESALTTLVSELKGLVVWPYDVAIHAWQPKIFQCQRFRHVRVIIDSTEIRLERASASTAQSTTWSQYKNSNTIKVLVGITPNGLISYISECWGGKISDKQLVLQTDFTKYLDYGDEVMADRGFNVTEELQC